MTRNTGISALPRSIVLVGLMGAGKSSIGRRVAGKLGIPFFDSDAEIERAAGCTIAQLFAEHGEASFRDGERRVIRRLLAGAPIVLATGGGAFMDAETRAAIRASARSVWLRCDLPTLVRRVARRHHRPLLLTGNPEEILARLIELRYPVYAEADVIVDCDNGTQEATTARVLAALERHVAARRLTVSHAGGGYEVVVGRGVLARTGAELAALLPRRAVAVVSDATVAGLYLATLRAALAEAGIAVAAEAVVPAGEASKSLEHYGRVMDTLLGAGIDRATAVVALGGGVVGDLAGFVAATALRGLPLVQIPTTLLAQVDSSVGGKTGVNTAAGKNLVGSFHQPLIVLADTGVLGTLPRRELSAGYAEVVKAGLIGDAALYAWCEAHGAAVVAGDQALLAEAVTRAAAFKAAVVADDERESGGRALLNLGHTFAHALEAELGYGTLLHGEAVAIGLVLALRLSAALEFCAAGLAPRIEAHLAAVGLPTRLPPGVCPERLMARFAHDKKMRDGRLGFVLARGIGAAFSFDAVPAEVVAGVLAGG